jgi:hypothetical protein
MSEFTNEQKQPFLNKGRLIEQAFAQLLDNPKFASPTEDQLEHWDVKFETKIDVKGLKKIKRSDSEVNENIHWLEIKNVQGKPGSCYGEADFLAFELKQYWIIVSKLELQSFISKNIKKEWVEKPELYKLYQRTGRKDVLTLVTSYDLCYISSNIIKKNHL